MGVLTYRGVNALGQDLQRHIAVERRVPGLLHLAHPALADLGGDLVDAEPGAGAQGHIIHPTACWQGLQCESLRLTRVRGVPLASEALSLGDLGGDHLACSSVATFDSAPSHLTVCLRHSGLVVVSRPTRMPWP